MVDLQRRYRSFGLQRGGDLRQPLQHSIIVDAGLVVRDNAFGRDGAGFHHDHGRSTGGTSAIVLNRSIGYLPALFHKKRGQGRQNDPVLKSDVFNLKRRKQMFHNKSQTVILSISGETVRII